MDRFCPKCGAKDRKFVKNLCETCFWEEKVGDVPNNLRIFLCGSCFSYLRGKRWIRIRNRDPLSVAVEGAIIEFKRNIKLPNGTKIMEIKGNTVERNKSGMPKKVALNITFYSEGSSISLEREATVDYITCNLCQSIANGKYEAVVQIRGKEGPIDEKARKSIELNINKFNRGRDRFEITEVREKDGGIDVKFLTSSMARLFAKKISESMGANLKESTKIVGTDRMTGRKHYRVTISVRLPALEPGDIVSFKDRIFKVLGHRRDKFVLEDLEDHKKRSLPQRAEPDVVKISRSDIKRVSIGAKSGESVTILDLEEKSFLELPIEKISSELKEGDEGLLINLNGKEKVVRRT